MVIRNTSIVNSVMSGLKHSNRSEGTNYEKAAQLLRDYRDILIKKKDDNKTLDDIDNEFKDKFNSDFGKNSEYGLLAQNSIQPQNSF